MVFGAWRSLTPDVESFQSSNPNLITPDAIKNYSETLTFGGSLKVRLRPALLTTLDYVGYAICSEPRLGSGGLEGCSYDETIMSVLLCRHPNRDSAE